MSGSGRLQEECKFYIHVCMNTFKFFRRYCTYKNAYYISFATAISSVL